MASTAEHAPQGDPEEEARLRRITELQRADLGTARREYISTVDVPDKYRNVSLEQLEAMRLANVDAEAKRITEEHEEQLNAWTNAWQDIGNDVSDEELDAMMNGQSHRARLAETIQGYGGQKYTEPEVLFDGRHRPYQPHHHQSFGPVPKGPKKKGSASIINAAGRTRKLAPTTQGSHPAAAPPSLPPSAPASFGSKRGGKKKKPTIASRFDPALNPSLTPGQVPPAAIAPQKATGPRPPQGPKAMTQGTPAPGSLDPSRISKSNKPVPNRPDSQSSNGGASHKPPRHPHPQQKFDVVDSEEFMAAVSAKMPSSGKAKTSAPSAMSGPSAPSVATATSRRASYNVVDDADAFMEAFSSSTRQRHDSITSVSQRFSKLSVDTKAGEVTMPKDSSVDTQAPLNAHSPVQSPKSSQPPQETEQQEALPEQPIQKASELKESPPASAHSPEEASPKTEIPPEKPAAAVPVVDLLDLDFNDEVQTVTLPNPISSQPLQPQNLIPLAPTAPSATSFIPPQSIPPQYREKERIVPRRWLRLMSILRREVKKINKLLAKAMDDELREYLTEQKEELEEDIVMFWEELQERYEDADLKQVEEEVQKMDAKMNYETLGKSSANLEHTHQETPDKPLEKDTKEQSTPGPVPEEPEQEEVPKPEEASGTPAAEEDTPSVRSPAAKSEQLSVTASSVAPSTVNAAAPEFRPSRAIPNAPDPSNGEHSIFGDDILPGRDRPRSITSQSVTPSMASNFSHPGRNIGAVTGFQSQQQTPEPPYSPPSSISPHPTLVQQQQYETSVYAQAPLEFYQPMYADPYRAAAATTPFHTIQTQSQYPPYQGNRHFSPIKEVLAFNIGKEMSQGLYQPHEAATVDPSFSPSYMQAPQNLDAQLQRPSNGLVASRWADPAASTNPPRTPTPKKSPLETFISKSRGRGISIKPAEDAVDTASNGNANGNPRSPLSNTNAENIPPKAVGSSNAASAVSKQIDGNQVAAKAQAMTRSVGLAASKWA